MSFHSRWMSRNLWRRAAQGAVLALGAPFGWLGIRLLQGETVSGELSSSPLLYMYLCVPTLLVFTGFGAVIGLHEDRLESANRRLEELSFTDPLTGLKNLRYFRLRLEEEYASARREHAPIAIAILDLDHFKRVNDELGHQTGDDLLEACGCAILEASRRGETAARVGGEEFGILLPGNDGASGVRVAERVRESIASIAVSSKDGVAQITASVGVASSAELGCLEADELYGAADAALYQAKRNGRDRVVLAGGVRT